MAQAAYGGKPFDIGLASDYAVVDAGPWTFYYGYEYDIVPDPEYPDADMVVWGFEAKRDGTAVLRLSYDEMCAQWASSMPKYLNKYDVEKCLLWGMAVIINAHPKLLTS